MDKHYVLAADIDLDPNLPGNRVFDRAVIAPDVNDIESYFQGTPFSGIFDGQGHVIRGLTIAGKDCLGLFGQVSSGAQVKGLGVEGASIVGNDVVGGLVGYNWGTVSNSFWDMESSGLSGSDGGVGLTTSEMMDPNMLALNGLGGDPNWVLDAGRDYPRLAWEGTDGQLIPEPRVDWLTGTGTAEDPYRIDTADQLILLGKASILWDRHFVLGADIDLNPTLPGRRVFGQAVILHFTGVFDGNGHVMFNLTIRGVSDLGLFGRLGAVVKNLRLAHVNVVGTGDYVGGLVGDNQYGTITSSYSTGSVSGWGNVGGLVGSNSGIIAASYSTNSVRDEGWGYTGGLVGQNSSYGTVSNCFWDKTTSGQSTSDGGTGLTTAQMQDIQTFLDAGWDLVNTWCMPAKDYPRLKWEDACE